MTSIKMSGFQHQNKAYLDKRHVLTVCAEWNKFMTLDGITTIKLLYPTILDYAGVSRYEFAND